ncbi:MAG: metallophosphatase family protein [Bellilinea sp.]|nr:metallophosphatase family protein [Bellilinea sp.]
MIQPDVLFRNRSRIVIGVIADTHVPDRVDALHPELEKTLRSEKVDAIIHAADISSPVVVRQLEHIAPVFAVRGNRDWAFTKTLPWSRTIVMGDVRILLVHGQGGLGDYLVDKVCYLLDGYRPERYLRLIERYLKDEQVIIFGHTHRALVLEKQGRLFLNPGSAAFGIGKDGQPSIGILEIEERQASARIVNLSKLKANGRGWRKF